MARKVTVPALATVQENYAGSASRAEAKYETKIKLVTGWNAAASSDTAEKNFSDAMADVLAKKVRQKKLKKVSDADWQKAALDIGGPALRTKIGLVAPKFATGVSPFLDAMNGYQLKDKTRDGIQNIENNSKGLARVLIAKKLALLGL